MKIAMANAVLPSPGFLAGVAMQVHGLANALVKRGHTVDVFSQSSLPIDALYNLRRITLPLPVRRGLRSFVQAGALGIQSFERYDVVHTHGDNYLLFALARQLRTFHGAAIDEAQNTARPVLKAYYRAMAPLEQLGARVSAWNVGVSEATRRRITRIDQVIPCGLDTMTFRPAKKSDEPSILFVGGLNGRKRGRLVLEAFKRDIRPVMPNAKLHLVTTDDASGDGITTYAGIDSVELARLYATSWVFCLPSSYEGFGVPYIEAMASGTAVLATPNVGAREVLQDGAFGAIVEPEALGSALASLLRDDNLRSSYVQRGIDRSRRYDWSIVAADYELAYERVIRQAPSFWKRWGAIRAS